MLVANDQNNVRSFAWQAQKVNAPFTCPACLTEVILRQGNIRAAHFAHKPPVSCAYGKGESDQHYRAKRAIYNSLCNHPRCRNCDVETILPGVRPDVSFATGGSRIAIEFQKSTLDVREIQRRMWRAEESRNGWRSKTVTVSL